MSNLTDEEKLQLKKIEVLEQKYLNKYFYFLKFAEDELLFGFRTKYKIKDDWYPKWNPTEEGKGISDFATGAERIVYSLLNGKGIGQPNSSPIGADLFFEVEDAFIHIDLKTVQTRNIGDYTSDIFVGNNQNNQLVVMRNLFLHIKKGPKRPQTVRWITRMQGWPAYTSSASMASA